MPFLGSTPPTNYKTLSKQTITGDGSTSYSLDFSVASGNEIEVFVNSVRQEPGTDYSASGTTITFTTAVGASDDCWLLYQGKAETTSLVKTTNIEDGAVTNAKYGGAINVNTSATDDTVNIDASGNVGIGTSSPMVALNVHNSTNARIALTNSSTGQTFPDGVELLATGLDAYLQNRSNGPMIFTTNNTERMRILSGGGLTFNGDTATANALDDYEEGTFTPAIGGSTSNGSISYSGQTGTYTKIGRNVYFSISINVSSVSSQPTGYVFITGLPFGVSDRGMYTTSIATSSFAIGGTTPKTLRDWSGGTLALLGSDNNGGGWSWLTWNDTTVQNSTKFIAWGWFETA